ncbi:MAG: hypothetical protein V1778_01920 [bacterium]
MQSLPTQNEPPAPKKKRHRLRTTVILLILVFVVVPIGFLGWSGVYHIPVLSSAFGSNTPIDLGIHPTAADLTSAERDNPMKLVGEPGQFHWTRNKTFSGTVAVDDEHTSAELTAFIQKYHGSDGHIRDLQVKVRQGGLEISTFVVPYINAPVFVDVDVVRASATSVSLNLRQAKVGRLTIPKKYYDDITRAAERIINREIAKIPGLSIETLEYRDGIAYLKGTLPATVTLANGTESVETLLR